MGNFGFVCLRIRFVSICLIALLGLAPSAECSVAATVDVTIEFFDTSYNPLPDIVGPDGVPDIMVGSDFIFRCMVDGPPEGLEAGWVDVEVTDGSGGFAINGTTLNSVFDIYRTGTASTNSVPQFDDYGGAIFDGGFAADGDDWWFEAECTAGPTVGVMEFYTAQGQHPLLGGWFTVTGGSDLDQPGDVSWGCGYVNVIPEPASISLLSIAALGLLKRRKR